MSTSRIIIVLAIAFGSTSLFTPEAVPPRQMERLGRGVVAINKGEGNVYVGWRLLGTDPDAIAFNLYRATNRGKPVKLNGRPITEATSFVDAKARSD
jgi:rhamnogalacturonan endolyase